MKNEKPLDAKYFSSVKKQLRSKAHTPTDRIYKRSSSKGTPSGPQRKSGRIGSVIPSDGKTPSSSKSDPSE